MTRKKLHRFAEIETFGNVGIGDSIQAKLKKFLTANDEITIEIGCGRGEHTIQLAGRFPDQKYIGIDYQGERIWYGAKVAQEKNLQNALFLQMRGEELLEYFSEHSIEQIIIPFPDPFPKDRHMKRRLISPRFLDIYKSILKTDGVVHFKTDDQNLFAYAKETLEEYGAHIIQCINDVPEAEGRSDDPILRVHTYYEQKHRRGGKKIMYLRFQFIL